MATLGKTIHLKRLQNPASGRIFTVALDHAPSYGVLPGLENMPAVLEQVVAAGPDAVLLMKGAVEKCFSPYAGRVSLILKCSSLSPLHPERDVLVSSVEDALRLGADAVAMAVTIGSRCQPEILSDLARLVREAERVGLPVIAHAYPFGELIPRDERYSLTQVGYAARLAMELGVDIVKSPYTGSLDTFAKVVAMASPALVVAAGGPKLNTERDVLRMAHGVVQSGAAGITFGRNIWQCDNLPGLMCALKHIVHENGSVAAAIKMAGR